MNRDDVIRTIDALCSYVTSRVAKARKFKQNGNASAEILTAVERADYVLEQAHKAKMYVLATSHYVPDPTATLPAPDPLVMELIGQYWDLGFTEGKTGVNQSDAANKVLHEIRVRLAAPRATAAWSR